MRCVRASLFALLALMLFGGPYSAMAGEIDLDKVIENETNEQLCDRLAVDPFTGFGPETWAKPFEHIDYYRAVPACFKAMEAHADEPRYRLQLAFAFLAAKKNDAGKKLLGLFVEADNCSAMLALAFVSPPAEAAQLMQKAGEHGCPAGTMLFGMSELSGAGVAKDEVDGVRMIRRAADAGFTRAMLILANFYNEGTYGVGYDPAEANRLIAKAAQLGDPRAKDILTGEVESQ